jgi:hypothetical protein
VPSPTVGVKTSRADPAARVRRSLPPGAERFGRARPFLARTGPWILSTPLFEVECLGPDCAAPLVHSWPYSPSSCLRPLEFMQARRQQLKPLWKRVAGGVRCNHRKGTMRPSLLLSRQVGTFRAITRGRPMRRISDSALNPSLNAERRICNFRERRPGHLISFFAPLVVLFVAP